MSRLIELVDSARALLDAERAETPDFGIRGAVGDALFACAVGADDAHVWIQRAIDDLTANGGEASLHRGFAGLAFVIASYAGDEDLLGDLDEAIAANVATAPPASMQSGAAGIALYASLRTHAESGRELARAVVETLRASAAIRDGGVVWHTPASYATARRVDVRGEPVLEYGMVHGVAGTLVGLAALAARGDAQAAELARAALAAAWSNARDGANRFGRVLFGDGGALGTLEFATPRWCVGDPGVLRAIWIAARVVGDDASAERAREALRVDAARDAHGPDALEGRLDLCCGAAAVAQVYLRMHRETGDAIFRDAHRALLARCASGIDGVVDRSFAYGRMGILLALLAAESDDDPTWDAILGMRLPCARAR
jgi:hypothetical protein